MRNLSPTLDDFPQLHRRSGRRHSLTGILLAVAVTAVCTSGVSLTAWEAIRSPEFDPTVQDSIAQIRRMDPADPRRAVATVKLAGVAFLTIEQLRRLAAEDSKAGAEARNFLANLRKTLAE